MTTITKYEDVKNLSTEQYFNGNKFSIDAFNRKYAAHEGETYVQGIKRVCDYIASVEKTDALRKYWAERWFDEIYNDWWHPAGSIMQGAVAGRKVSAMNCTSTSLGNTRPDEEWDNLESIIRNLAYKVAKYAAYRQGNGMDVSRLRPRGSNLLNSANKSTGAVHWMKFIDGMADFVGQCIHPETMVFTEDGYMAIRDIVENKYSGLVLCKNGWSNVVGWFKNDVKPIVRITTEYGNIIRVSPDHEIETPTGKVCAKNLKPRDFVTCSRQKLAQQPGYVVLSGFEYQTDSYNNSNRLAIPNALPTVLHEDFAYLLGYMYGNGSHTCSHVEISLPNKYPEIFDKLNSAIGKTFGQSIGDYGIGQKPGDGECTSVWLGRYYTAFLKHFGLMKGHAHHLSFPELIKRSPDSVVIAFFCGLFDADGYNSSKKRNIDLALVDGDFLYQLKLQLERCGIVCSLKTTRKKSRNWQPVYRMSIVGTRGQSDNRLLRSHKISLGNVSGVKDRLKTPYKAKHIGVSIGSLEKKDINASEYLSDAKFEKYSGKVCDLYIQRVLSIESEEDSVTYDITVEDQSHLFSAEGILVSNSGRKPALLLSLSCNHPDLVEFIKSKSDTHSIQNANISVQITDDFYLAVRNNEDWVMSFEIPAVKTGDKIYLDKNSATPDCKKDKDGRFYYLATKDNPGEKINKREKARYLLELIARGMCDYGEPGIQNIDIARRLSNSDYMYDPKAEYDSRICSTNACLPGWARVLTPHGIRTLNDVSIGDMIWSETGWTKVVNKWSTGTKVVRRYRTRGSVFYGTDDHRVVSDGKKAYVCQVGKIDNLCGEIDSSGVDMQDVIDGQNFSVKDYRLGHIPDRFLFGSRKTARGFLYGLLLRNARVDKNNVLLPAIPEGIAEDIQVMLSSVGVPSHVTDTDWYGANIVANTRRVYEAIGCLPIGNDTIHIRDDNTTPINPSDLLECPSLFSEELVYDITVDNSTHTYWTDGSNVSNCSEQFLSPDGNCCLGSINAGKFSTNPDEYKKQLEVIGESINRFLDNVNEAEVHYQTYATDDQRVAIQALRRTGAGITNIGAWLFMANAEYGSKEGNEQLEEFAKWYNYYLYKSSIAIGKEKGSFGLFNREKLERSPFIKRMMKLGLEFDALRNVTVSSIAPTGCSFGSTTVIVDNKPVSLWDMFEECGVNTEKLINEDVGGTWFDVKDRNMSVKTHTGQTKRITKLYYNGFAPVVSITANDGKVFSATLDHKIIVSDKDKPGAGSWKRMCDIVRGDQIVRSNAAAATVTDIGYDYGPTFDIEVEDDHSYVTDSVISHNTLSLMFREEVMSYGIEPAFGIYFWKRTRISGKYEYYFCVPSVVRQAFKAAGVEIPMKSDTIKDTWDGKHGKPIAKFIDENKDKVGVKFKGATEISALDKLNLMAGVAKWIDSSISVTYLLPEGSQWKDVYDFILLAHEKGLKSIAAFPDRKMYGIVAYQPFKELAFKLMKDGVQIHRQNFSDEELAELDKVTGLGGSNIVVNPSDDRPKSLPCHVHHVKVVKKLDKQRVFDFLVLVGVANDKPVEIFAFENGHFDKKITTGEIVKTASRKYDLILAGGQVVSNITKDTTASEDALTRQVSLHLRCGTDINLIVEQLEKVEDDMLAFSKALARALKKYIKDGTPANGQKCPKCGVQMIRLEGCATCPSCSYSKCS